jgi:hypothetical protein
MGKHDMGAEKVHCAKWLEFCTFAAVLINQGS